jgi:hypothetical protein
MKKIFFLCCCVLNLTLACGFQAASQVKEEFDNLIFYIPGGLSINKTETALMINDSLLTNGQNFSITINRTVLSLKKIEKSFPVFWRESLLNDGIDNPPSEPPFVKSQTSTGWNCFRAGKMVAFNSQSAPFYYHLIVLRYLGITVKIITRSSSEELFMQRYPQLMQMVSAVSFKTPPPAQQKTVATTQKDQ